MEKIDLKGLTPEEVKDVLDGECTQVILSIFVKPFKDDDRDRAKITVSNIEEEIFENKIHLAKINEPIKAHIKELEESKNIVLCNLRDGGLETEEKLYEFFDRAQKKVFRFTEEGIEVEARAMTEEEIIQLNINE